MPDAPGGLLGVQTGLSVSRKGAVDVRFDLGLADVDDVPDSPTELENRNFQATAGYVISVP